MLIDGLRLVDATLYNAADRWWMFANSAAGGTRMCRRWPVLIHSAQPLRPMLALSRPSGGSRSQECVAKLSPAHREIINLVYYHEKSVEEVGEIIGIPQSTVKTRMFYARKQLADLLKGAGIDSLAA